MKWIKRATNRHSHPDIQAAGFWGTVYFDEICAIAGEFESGSTVPAKYATAQFVGRRLGLHAVEGGIGQLEGGIRDCFDAGLLEDLDGGDVGIPGWEGIQSDSSTSRVQRHRARKQAGANETDVTVTSVSSVSGVRDETSVTGRNGPEESRVEESREETLSSNSAVAEPDLRAESPDLEPDDGPPDRYRPQDLVADWNKHADPAMPRAKLTGSRRRKIETRLRENPQRDWWLDVIDAASASPHCRGESRPQAGASRPWRCTIDFLVDNDTNAQKILDGNYGDDRARSAPVDERPTRWL